MVRSMSRAIRALLGEGRISREDLRRATLLQGRYGATLSYHLVQIGSISEQDLLVFFLYHFPVEHWSAERLTHVAPTTIGMLSADIAGDLRVLPILRSDSKLVLGITDPSRTHALEEVAFHTNCFIKPALVSESDMTWALGHYYGVRTSSEEATPRAARADQTRPLDLSRIHRAAARRPEPRPEPPQQTQALPLVRPSTRSSLPAPVSSYARLASDAGQVSYMPVELTELYSLDDLAQALGKARTRDDVVRVSLELLSRVGERTAFFTVLRSEIRGFAIRGTGASASSIRAFWIPSSARSTLADALAEQAVHLGPLGRAPADGVLAAALGGRPERVLVVPVAIRGRAVGALYADHLKVEMPDLTSLSRLGDEVGLALGKLLSGK
jgi:hypothetical protein